MKIEEDSVDWENVLLELAADQGEDDDLAIAKLQDELSILAELDNLSEEQEEGIAPPVVPAVATSVQPRPLVLTPACMSPVAASSHTTAPSSGTAALNQAIARWRATNDTAAPDPATVQPGQDDSALETYLTAWMAAKRRKRDAAEKVYAGILGATAPKLEDYATFDDQQGAYRDWLERCTPTQRKILAAASAARKARERASDNARARGAYAARAAEEGKAVRNYVHHKTDEERAEAKRKQDREAQRRKRAAETPAQADARRIKNAEAMRLRRAWGDLSDLDKLLLDLSDLDLPADGSACE
jgi:hypothetical protein